MRLVKAHVDGFGALVDATFQFAPGVNVIFGPNEAGKTTLHEFLLAMLYGMKKPGQPNRRAFEPVFAHYRPWQNGAAYGGQLEYELAAGQRFEVHRRFSRRREEVRIHALPGGTDRTADFPRERNGEVQFAQAHLGLGKSLFASAACIRHASVNALAPDEALATIRDRIAALADTGREDHSTKKALAALDAAAAAIGTDRARTKPVACLRRELETLQKERAQVVAARQELARAHARRAELEGHIDDLTARTGEAQRLLAEARRAELAAVLDEADRIAERAAQLDREIEALAPYADFPADRLADLIELNRECQLHRDDLAVEEARTAKLAAEVQRLNADLEPLLAAAQLPDDALEAVTQEATRLADLDRRVATLVEEESALAAEEAGRRARLAPLENRRREVAPFLDAGDDVLAELWRIEETVTACRRELNQAQVAAENLHVHTLGLAEQLAPLKRVFDGVTADLEDLRARYEAGQRAFETIRQEIAPELNRRRAHRFELGATIQQCGTAAWLVAFLGVLALGLTFLPFLSGLAEARRYFGLGGVGALVVAAVFIFRYVALSRTLRRAAQDVEGLEARLADEKSRVDAQAAQVGALLDQSPYRTLGEYISGYATYLRLVSAHEESAAAYAQAAVAAQAVHDRRRAAHARAGQILSAAGITFENLDDLPEAIARFCAGHRAARQAAEDLKDARRDLESAVDRRSALARQLASARAERDEVIGQLRGHCRAAGVEAAEGEGVAAAVDQFKSRFRQARLLLSQVEERTAQLQEVRASAAALRNSLEKSQGRVRAILESAGVGTIEAFRVGLERHAQWKALTAERERLAEARTRVLAGRSVEALRAELAEESGGTSGSGFRGAGARHTWLNRAEVCPGRTCPAGSSPTTGSARPDETGRGTQERTSMRTPARGIGLKEQDSGSPNPDWAAVRTQLEVDKAALAAAREDLAALKATIDSLLAPFRPLAAVDEDLAAAQARLDRLLLLRGAIALARDTIDQVGRWAYANLAPHLNEVLGRTVAEITGGRYHEVTVDEDLSVWVRVPQTGRRLPPGAFSRGAIDQFYFTLRLGVVDLLKGGREPVPLILDDPFTNYDDQRLAAALAVLARRAETNQVLLFTCQRRVRDRARKHQAAVIALG